MIEYAEFNKKIIDQMRSKMIYRKKMLESNLSNSSYFRKKQLEINNSTRP